MFDCGDVLIVPVPFSDLSAAKQRPVIVVGSISHSRHSNFRAFCFCQGRQSVQIT